MSGFRSNRDQLIDSRWYAIADLACVTSAGFLWYFTQGQLGWWPLLIAILPWPLRILNGRFPLKRTPFDLFLLLFFITALIGVSTAYNQDAAWAKFWLIIGAILLFYALAGQSPENVWPVWGTLGILGSVFAIYFLLHHNWLEYPIKFTPLQNMITRWMSLRPQLPASLLTLYPNDAGGLMAVLAPALVALIFLLFHQHKWLLMAAAGLAGILLMTGLLLSMSRGALLALGGGFLIWLTWFASRIMSQILPLSRRQTFLLLLLLLLLIATIAIAFYPGGLAGIAELLPGPNRVNRLSLSQDTLNLIQDYLITGGGLASFPGLYSQYSQITPVYLFIHAHNLYLDVALEQGIFGFIMLLAIVGLSYWLLSGLSCAIPFVGENDLLHGSLLAGLTVILLHGLVDDPLYGSNGILVLFAFSGITAAITRIQPPRINVSSFQASPPVILWTVVLILGALATILFLNSLRSTWHANSGAVKMTQVELDGDWPTNLWQGDSKVPHLAGAEENFARALALNEKNVTALFRLGLIALARQDFDKAVGYLTAAQYVNPQHRGVQKALGYSALWNGDLVLAGELLSPLPESTYELGNYIGWWRQQGKPELGEQAAELLKSLQNQ